MKLEEAIEVQTAYIEGRGVDQYKLIDAIKVGKEALKEVIEARLMGCILPHTLLPGETVE